MTDIARATPAKGLAFLFKGKDGLRAGWSLVLFFAIVALIGVGLAALLPHPSPAHGAAPTPMPSTPLQTIRNEAIGFASVAVASVLVALVERRSFTAYGLRRERALPDLLTGMAWGVAMLSVLIGLLALVGALSIDGIALAARPALGYGAAWFIAFLLVALFEEILFRGFLQFTLARGVAGIAAAIAPRTRHARTIGFWVAAFVFSIGLFAAAHLTNKGETTLGLVSVALAGLTLVYVLYRTGSLWWAVGFHATWDFMQSFFYGVRDSGLAVQGHLLVSHPVGAAWLSGGETGPEGSILVVPVLLATIAIIHRTLPRRATAFDA